MKNTKRTFRKCVDIAQKMRETGNYSLDVSKYSPVEVMNIAILAKNDNLFAFFQEVADMDIAYLLCACRLLEVKEAYSQVVEYREV